jgi:hypothetical protein
MNDKPCDAAAAATAHAWGLVSLLCQILSDSIRRGKEITSHLSAGEVDDTPILGCDGKLHATGHLDGSYEIHISVKALPAQKSGPPH